jgi:endonuclease-3
MTPKKIEQLYELLSKTYRTFDEVENEWGDNGLSSKPFKSLVSVMLSTMTHTKRVIKAANALYAEVSTPQELLRLSDEHLTELIRPVAHYNRKTQHLKQMCRQLIERHGGEVPRTRDELMALQGVGRKCTDILLNFTFDQPAIAVDTHMFRVLNRVGVVHTESQTVAADEINRLTPDRFKRHAHEWLIQHGGKVCGARKPKCDECPLTKLCEYYQDVVAA